MSNVTVVKNSISAKDKAVSELELYKDYYQTILLEKESAIEAQKKTIDIATDNLKISKENLDRAFILILFLVICASVIHRDFWNNLLYPVYNISDDLEYITRMIITVLFMTFIGRGIIKKWGPLTIFVLIITLYSAVLLSDMLSPTCSYGILIGFPTLYLLADLFLDEAKDESLRENWHHLKKHFIFKSLHRII